MLTEKTASLVTRRSYRLAGRRFGVESSRYTSGGSASSPLALFALLYRRIGNRRRVL